MEDTIEFVLMTTGFHWGSNKSVGPPWSVGIFGQGDLKDTI